ncbi:MAG: hypothetical protein JO048_02225 [Methylobacteriaceae bacterium]|nr:hypothetical protein [Methylobacteriaceae bacterium]
MSDVWIFRPAATLGLVPVARGPRHGRPHAEETVARVRRLWETTILVAREIARQTGVSPGTVIRWANVCGWERPPYAPRAAHQWPGGRPGHAVRRSRTIEASLREAGTAIATCEAAERVEIARLAEAVANLQTARALLSGPPLKRPRGCSSRPVRRRPSPSPARWPGRA